MESYFAAKRRLFEHLPQDAPAVVNIDDPRGASLIGFGAQTLTYAISRPADVMPGPLTFSVEGLVFEVTTPVGLVRVQSKLVGKVNVYNILAAVGTAVALGLPVSAIERGLASLQGVPGRFELVSEPRDGVSVIVDYAHTPDGLRGGLVSVRDSTDAGRVIVVFGCGGDRDRDKRPEMGEVAAGLADLLVAAIIISGFPGTAAWAIGLLVGLNLLFGGASLIGVALYEFARSLASARRRRLANLLSAIAIGLAVTSPILLFTDGLPHITARGALLIAGMGVLTLLGYLTGFNAFKHGKVTIVAPIIACEGAVAAVFSILLGETMDRTILLILPIAIVGVEIGRAHV